MEFEALITLIKAKKSPIDPIFDAYITKISTLEEIKTCKKIGKIDGPSMDELEAF